MNTAGFDRLRETARFSSSTGPDAGPATREELVADCGAASANPTATAVQEGGDEFMEVVNRQQAVSSLKGGNLFVRDIAVPDNPVAPDGTVRIEVTVSKSALEIFPWDPGHCTLDDPDPIMGPSGYKTQLRVEPAWSTRDTRDFCIGKAAVGTRDLTFEFPFPAPAEEGVHQIEVSLFLPNAGTGSNVATRSIRVTESGKTDPEPNGAQDDEEDEDAYTELESFDHLQRVLDEQCYRIPELEADDEERCEEYDDPDDDDSPGWEPIRSSSSSRDESGGDDGERKLSTQMRPMKNGHPSA